MEEDIVTMFIFREVLYSFYEKGLYALQVWGYLYDKCWGLLGWRVETTAVRGEGVYT